MGDWPWLPALQQTSLAWRAWFWESFVEDAAGCWIWTHSLNKHGYGKVRLGRYWVGTHRVSFVLAGGKLPNGYVVGHACDNRICGNPDHLEGITSAVNRRDMRRRGRGAIRLPTGFWVSQLPIAERSEHALAKAIVQREWARSADSRGAVEVGRLVREHAILHQRVDL